MNISKRNNWENPDFSRGPKSRLTIGIENMSIGPESKSKQPRGPDEHAWISKGHTATHNKVYREAITKTEYCAISSHYHSLPAFCVDLPSELVCSWDLPLLQT